jgi:hypothetical protein
MVATTIDVVKEEECPSDQSAERQSPALMDREARPTRFT